MIAWLAWYQVLNLVAVAGVMTMLPSCSQAGGPEKMASERPSVPWLSMHCTSRAGASEARNRAAWLLVGVGTGGGDGEQPVAVAVTVAVAAQASRRPVIARA